MTKTVRIENGDSGTSFEVVAEVYEGETKVDEKVLWYPTQMLEVALCEGRRVVITERPRQPSDAG